MNVAITGVTGYIGEALARRAAAQGHAVLALSRQPPRFQVANWLHYDLRSALEPALPVGTDAVVHLALSGDGETIDLPAARRLICATRAVSARLVFVSSQTARPDAPTEYGRAKWAIERIVLESGGWVVRPGQVYGGAERGLFGQLVDGVRAWPALPAFVPAPRVQPIHVDDLACALIRLIERSDIPPGILCLGAEKAITFTALLRAIAAYRLRCRRLAVPIPAGSVALVRRMVGERRSARLGLDRLASLLDLPAMRCGEDLARLGLTLRPIASGMHPSGDVGRRSLAGEGRALLAYVLGESPGVGLIRRYVRAVESLREGRSLGLPRFCLRWPRLLAGVERTGLIKGSGRQEFAWRLDAATVLAEATPAGARAFLGLDRARGPARATARILAALAAESFWRIACLPWTLKRGQ